MNRFFPKKDMTAYAAITEAQKISFAPIIFQVVRTLRDMGIMDLIDSAANNGISMGEIRKKTGLDSYGISVLLDSGVSSGVIEVSENNKYTLSKVGYYLLHDKMTRINMDYNHFVCYQGMYYLDEAIRGKTPAGLKVFGEQWETLYQALPHLPTKVQESWYAFDHFYSDSAYPEAIKILIRDKPRHLVDVGTNIGKFSILLANLDPDVQITMLDLPDQLQNAVANISHAGHKSRVTPVEINLLDDECRLPEKKDAYWMSQLLSCFGADEIISILVKVRHAMTKNSFVYILETCWDRQQHAAAAYSLINTSLYFTAMASGNSKMYHSKELIDFIETAGLKIKSIHDSIGVCHSLFVCSLET